MELIRTEDAVGQVLCHDITQIIPGVAKDAVFRKGHVVRPEDIPVLLSVGKEHLYVWEKDENTLHEDEAADILRSICQGEYMSASQSKEGKIELTAQTDGLLLVDTERLRAVNRLGEMMIATRSSGLPVKQGDKLCGTRVIPLVIEREKMERARLPPETRCATAVFRTHLPPSSRRNWRSTAVRGSPMKFWGTTTRKSPPRLRKCWQRAANWCCVPVE